MSLKSSLLPTVNWQEIIEQQLVRVTSNTPVVKAISLMSQQHSSCVVIEEKGQLEGIFTERDAVKLTASGNTIEGVAIADVMNRQPLTLSTAEKLNITELVIFLERHSIRHLPLVNSYQQIVGVITHRSLRNALKASYLLRKKQVKEALDGKMIQEKGNRNISYIAEVLAHHQVSCVVIVRRNRQNTIPVGIITERDIVNFQALGLNLQQTTAQEVMSTPLLLIHNNNSLWDAHQLMEQQDKRRLVAIKEDGTLAGIISQKGILKALNIDNIYRCIETLESLLEQKNQQLEATKADLEAQVHNRTKELAIANKLLQQQINERLSDEALLTENIGNKSGWWLNLSYKISNQLKKLHQLNLPQWTGGVIAAVIALTVELLRRSGIIVPVPFLLILLTTISSASLGGIIPGLWSTLVWSLFVIYAATVPFGSPTITGGVLQVLASILVVAFIAIIEGCIKEQNRRLTQTIRWVNRNLDREVHQRMEELSVTNSFLRKEIRDRIAAETKLKESEAKYRAIFEQAAVGIVRTSLDKKFLAVNPKYCEMVGYSAEELSQLTFTDITHPEDRASDDKYTEQLLSRKSSISAEKRYVHKEGSIFWVKLTANLVLDEQNQPSYFIGIIENIDRRKRAELALEESEKRFFETINSFPFAVWTSNEEGECNYFNRAWLELTGKTLEQQLNHAWSEGVHPEDIEHCLNTYQSAFTKRENFAVEYRLKRFDGEYRWLLDKGKPRFYSDGSFAGYVGACLDISDRIKAKKEREELLGNIEEKNQFLENVLQQMPAGVVIVKAPHGEVILSNQQLQDTLGHPLIPINQISDYTKYGCLDSEDKPRKLEDHTLFKVLREQKTISGEEVRYRCGDGIIRTLLVNAAPILNSESETIAAIATFSDISELKQAQALKKDAQLNALILKEINHRIKNNLQIISALLDLQSEQTATPETLKLLEESQARIQTIALIHEKLYTSENLDSINFVEYVQSLASYLHDSFIPQNKQIKINFDLEPIELDIDSAIPCGLIINELILNAIQHGFKERQKGEIKISFYQVSQNKLCLIVQDNGKGITKDVDFENIQSLGLNLVYSLVSTQLEGTLCMQKIEGTIFKIEFPINKV